MNTSYATAASPAISCNNCAACCCRLEVMLMGEDDIPAKYIARDPWGGWVMLRLDDGWCAALDRDTMRCTIYARRPGICRDYPMGDSDCIEVRALHLSPDQSRK
ncbi:MAG: YkgJ family cysteine cluster protein [Rhodocyclaceae bacterium]|nr:YkgJ family cysteine cluster protein [Rhodocyclaceae bacterium]MDP3030634.1 YkgJ family cysteine cluster protein [Rhodocyclaceae bacterium]